MRWDGQRIGADDGALPDLTMPDLALHGLLRSVRTPDFAGVTFHEVAAKSALNKVPAASSMPFRWTINPMRGCLHACAYCLSGDTGILLADGRTRRLDDVRVGDRVVGTRLEGRYRRYVTTEVLAHWRTEKRAYRVTLADSTTLVASGDHRFLTERGWKHVTGGGARDARRPHLTSNNSLLGFGQGDATAPKEDAEYRRGYLTGMIRGDAHVGRYADSRPGREGQVLYRFRLALADEEALDRSRTYLADEGISTTTFRFSPVSEKRREMTGLRASSRRAIEAVEALTAWPLDATDQWSRGFLAGIFDAEGSCSRGVLRISNSDPTIIGAITAALARFDLRHVVEDHGRANRVTNVRLLGGLPARMRFFLLTDPAITRKRSLVGGAVKSAAALEVVGIDDLGVVMPMVDITTGTGDFVANGVISHNCFARPTHEYLDLDAGRDFETQIVVKTNVVEVLRAELARPSWRREHVALGTNTDPYQRAEGRYRLMPGIIDALASSGTPFSILTKGTLLRRDIPALVEAQRRVPVGVAISLAVLDHDLQQSVEPGTPTARARLDLVRALRDVGLPCGVLVAPVMPWLTDSVEHLDGLLAELAAAGATGVTALPLHLRGSVKPWFLRWLASERPDLVGRYRRLYGTGAYAPREYKDWLHARLTPLLAAHGFGTPAARQADGAVRPEEGTYPRGSMAGWDADLTPPTLDLGPAQPVLF
ncbi:intein-containing Rv2578c family radical SAM protein [Actinotalea ferrariae]|uniref:intein-containing Rv2578c family radical SAM protein n=1 Tax=Actinotalea ferrariae TaxID=1386098 RepID=UPI001C8C143F|nr:intein-containing Rv2578c family radical SAM protein [Actinotalea ferrariae]MBX9246866.1 intein-containing Rv2578c family radical SAM protein [Actinotalea ferrariae]